MKGIILAGGTGSRLWPITQVVSKQLLPVYDKPMIYYPLTTLILSGVTDVLVITSPSQKQQFKDLLGDGAQWGIKISYASQSAPRGIAEAFIIGEDFIAGEPSTLILGDNLLYGPGMGRQLAKNFTSSGASICAYQVEDPSDYGVVVFGNDGRVIKLVEKSKTLISNWAIPGLYFYDSSVTDRARSLKPSSRGELEITDLNNSYLEEGALNVIQLPRATAWLDLGTPKNLLEASNFVQSLQDRQGLIIGSPEEASLIMQRITLDQLTIQADNAYYRSIQKLRDRPFQIK